MGNVECGTRNSEWGTEGLGNGTEERDGEKKEEEVEPAKRDEVFID
jgi:hypothetical protein